MTSYSHIPSILQPSIFFDCLPHLTRHIIELFFEDLQKDSFVFLRPYAIGLKNGIKSADDIQGRIGGGFTERADPSSDDFLVGLDLLVFGLVSMIFSGEWDLEDDMCSGSVDEEKEGASRLTGMTVIER
jgi:hypothetical protein